MKPRDYQQAAIDALWAYFAEHTGNPLVAMPTGTGKSIVIGGFIRSVWERFPGTRVMMLTHVKKLIEQNFSKLLTMWPTAPAGIYSAGLGRREAQCPIVFAGIASVAKRVHEFAPADIIVVDEAHLVSHRGETMYRAFIAAMLERNPKLKVIGLSATCYRMGLGDLTEGGIFTHVAFDLTTVAGFTWLVQQGYLAPLHAVRTTYRLDVGAARVQGGDYVQKDLQDALDHDDVTQHALQELVHVGRERKRWLVFATGVDHAEHIAERLHDAWGIEAAAIHSRLPQSEQDARFAAFARGDLQCAVSMNQLTTGVDIPEVDLIGMLRPTLSTSLWVQMLGRGTRPASGKQECLVLDFTDNTAKLGPINDPVLPTRPKKGKKRKEATGAAPIKTCPQCASYVHASLGTCPYCEHVFAINPKIHEGSSGLAVMRTEDPRVERFRVQHVTYAVQQRRTKPPVLVVSYHCQGQGNLPVRFRDWVCLEHEGMARRYAERWWRDRSTLDAPDTVQRALDLSHTISVPIAIKVWVNKPRPEIMDYEYATRS